MTRASVLIGAIVLGNVTLALQVPLSLAQGREAASAYRASLEALHGGSRTVARTPRRLRTATPAQPVLTVPPWILSRVQAQADALKPSNTPAETLPVFVVEAETPLPADTLAVVDQPGIRPRHRELTRGVLGQLAPECQVRLSTFGVVYDQPDHRGGAGRGTIIMNGRLTNDHYTALLTHEMAHFWDLTCLNGTASSGASEFRDGHDVIWKDDPSVEYYRLSWLDNDTRRPEARPEDDVSDYGAKDPFEGLAEGLTYYLLQREAFQARAAQNPVIAAKFAWFERYFPARQLAVGSQWNGTIPGDAARGTFRLLASTR